MEDRYYPETVAEVLDRRMKFKPAVLRAVRDFARGRPWRGSPDARRAKFRALHHALFAAYGKPPARLIFATDESRGSGRSCYIPGLHVVILRGRLSVITYLHEFHHAAFNSGERRAVAWSVNLFRRAFPRSFARLRFEGHMCRKGRR